MECICKMCGVKFWKKLSAVKGGRGKYCSKYCFYHSDSFRAWTTNPDFSKAKAENARRTGKLNKGKPGWNKGNKMPQYIKDILFKANFKGDKVGYKGLHQWISRYYGKADHCENPNCQKLSKQYHWSNVSHKYTRERKDWKQMCQKCHFEFDNNNWGIVKTMYDNYGRKINNA